MRQQATIKQFENYDLIVDYDTESSKVWVVIEYKSRRKLQRHEKEFSGKGAIKQAQEYLELFLVVIADKKELEKPVGHKELLFNSVGKVNQINSIMAAGVNKDELSVHIVMQNSENEVIQIAMKNPIAMKLMAYLEREQRFLDTAIYIQYKNKEERNDSPGDSHTSKTN
jgi:hypothetical protein